MKKLKKNIKIVPLIANWYAWTYLIPPHTSGLNIKNRILKIMDSFADNPDLHREAIDNPKLKGGPFMDLPADATNIVRNLSNKIQSEANQYLNLSNDIEEFYNYIVKHFQGQELDNGYAKLPESLRGAVELTYDLANNPCIRFIEDVIYYYYYDDNLQSIYLEEIVSQDLPFILGTPFLKHDRNLQINIPFSHSAIDKLAESRFKPITEKAFKELCVELKLNKVEKDLFISFFDESCTEKEITTSRDFKIKYFGHATILIQYQEINILIDPLLSYDIPTDEEKFSISDLPPEINYVIFTHNHQDHIVLEFLLQLRHRINNILVPKSNNGNILDPDLQKIFRNIGFKSVSNIEEFETLSCGPITIKAIPFFGEHSDLNIYSKLCYIVEAANNRIGFFADSRNIHPDLYKKIFVMIGKLDILFLGMECHGAPMSWLYGSLFPYKISYKFDQVRRLNGSDFEQAKSLVTLSGAREVYIYAMGMEKWLGHILTLDYSAESKQIIEANRFLAWCTENSIKSELLKNKRVWNFQ